MRGARGKAKKFNKAMTQHKKNIFLYPVGLALFAVAVDVGTKYLIEETLAPYSGRIVIPGFFNLVHVFNKGGAFGFLAGDSITWQRGFFIGVTALACVIILYTLCTQYGKTTAARTGFGLILGGAVGNLIDRVRYGHVVDFLDFYVGSWHWPAFNAADTAITCGTILVLWGIYRAGPEKK